MSTSVTQGTDIFNLGKDGFDYKVADETLTILRNIAVASDKDGVRSDFENSLLINRGNVISTSTFSTYFGVLFTAGTKNSEIVNQVGGLIIGYFGAVMEGGGSQIFDNFGKVVGTTNVSPGVYFDLLGLSPGQALLNNHGSIISGRTGVGLLSNNAVGIFHNYALVSGDTFGIWIDTPNSLTTAVTNAATGTIKSGLHAIFMITGGLSFTNAGKVVGDIDSADVRDVVHNHGIIRGTTHLYGGSDLFNGTGGKSGPVYGGDGNDRLIGGSHNDKLHGGNGNDKLTGGPSADQFVFDNALNAATNVDTITDFKPAEHDEIVLSETDFAGLGALGTLATPHFHIGHAVNANPAVIYRPGTGFLFYDANGNLPGGLTHFATLATHPTIHNTDFIVVG